jgi:hypothetical protein
MSSRAAHVGKDLAPREARPGRTWGIASLLLLPALIVLYVPLYFLGSAFQSALGLAEDELLTEAGAWGVAAALLMLALTAIPQVAGIALGVKARRLGEHVLGTAGIVANALVGAFLLLGSALQLLLG